jgi:hypothetical protein
MPRYQRRVTDVQAVRFDGSNADAIRAFAGGAVHEEADGQLIIQSPSGPNGCTVGDWVAQNPTDPSDFYVITAAQFEKLYNPTPIG